MNDISEKEKILDSVIENNISSYGIISDTVFVTIEGNANDPSLMNLISMIEKSEKTIGENKKKAIKK